MLIFPLKLASKESYAKKKPTLTDSARAMISNQKKIASLAFQESTHRLAMHTFQQSVNFSYQFISFDVKN